MILGNCEILRAIREGRLRIGDLRGDEDPGAPPFNTSSVDLHLGTSVSVPRDNPAAFDLRRRGLPRFLADNSDEYDLTEDQPFSLRSNRFILANTQERLDFPIDAADEIYSARIEGRSSIARCGLLIHFTAPTVHAGFHGPLTLEIINLGPLEFLLYPGMAICQLIVERVQGRVVPTENQFRGQTKPTGVV